MTRREIATLACKILAVWMFAEVAKLAPALAAFAVNTVKDVLSHEVSKFGNDTFRSGELLKAAIMMIPTASTLLVGLLLWFGAARLAARMVGDDPSPVTRPDITETSVLAVALAAIGVFTIVPIFQELARDLMQIAWTDDRFVEYWDSGSWQASFWTSMIGLAIGVWLIIGSPGIARFVLWVRTAGHKTEDQEE